MMIDRDWTKKEREEEGYGCGERIIMVEGK
jgi:hypothetical protein